MRRLYTLLGTSLFLTTAAFGQYTQDFSTLVNTGSGNYDTYPDGWGVFEVGSSSSTDGKYAVSSGTGTAGTAYSFGSAAGNTDRALGSIASNGLLPTIGVIFFNETENPITSVTISYTGEQWRYGGGRTVADVLNFDYSLDAAGIVTGTSTWVRVTQLDFLSPVFSGSARALDGNSAANRQALTYTITGLNIQPGERIVLRWSDPNITGNDDGLAIDDFSISAGLAPGVLTSGGTSIGGGTGDGGTTTNNNATSVPIFENKLATDSGFVHLYGNLHGHTTHSDGEPSTGTPVNAYTYARNAIGMDFLGISEHNHSAAGMAIGNYKIGSAQANAANGQLTAAGQPFVALHGMEWGTISGGGHVLVYGFKDSLINWEAGNNDILVAKGDYMNLFEKVRKNPEAIALLAHPSSSNFTGLTGAYKGVADSAVAGVAIESGPAFSTATGYNDYPASLAYINYYRSLLKQGYRVGAHMDQDNHQLTFGTANGNRMVVLAKDRTRTGVLNAIRAMRVYASNDYNAQVNFLMDGYVLGSSIVRPTNLSLTVTHSDADGEGITAIQVYGGRVGGGDAALVHSATANTTFTTTQADGETWYYYAIVTQADGNRIITSPIWLTRPAAAPLPVTLTDFRAQLQAGVVRLSWNTQTELNSDYFVVERSTDLVNYTEVGRLNARGSGSDYTLNDVRPASGKNFYRLLQVDRNGAQEYSRIVSVDLSRQFTVQLTPNPSRGLVQVRTTMADGQKVQVQVVDVAGNIVYNKQHVTSQGMRLDLSNLAGGFYVVRVGDVLTQLVIQK